MEVRLHRRNHEYNASYECNSVSITSPTYDIATSGMNDFYASHLFGKMFTCSVFCIVHILKFN